MADQTKADQKKSDQKKAERQKQAKEDAEGRLIIATNRRAHFEYEILDTWEAGIELRGPEVKSLRAGRANLGDAFAQVHRGEIWLEKLHISPYDPATRDNPLTRSAGASSCSTGAKSPASTVAWPRRGSHSFP